MIREWRRWRQGWRRLPPCPLYILAAAQSPPTLLLHFYQACSGAPLLAVLRICFMVSRFPVAVNPSPPRCLDRSSRREADEDQEKGGSGKRIRQSSLLFLPADITHFLPLLLPQEYIVCILFLIPGFSKRTHACTCVTHRKRTKRHSRHFLPSGADFRVTHELR